MCIFMGGTCEVKLILPMFHLIHTHVFEKHIWSCNFVAHSNPRRVNKTKQESKLKSKTKESTNLCFVNS